MEKIVLLILFIVLFVPKERVLAQEKSTRQKNKVLMIISPGDFRDEEYNEPKKYFEKKGIEIITGSTTTEIVYGSRDGTKVKPDILLKDVNVLEFVAIVFVGGPGARNYYNNSEALRIAKQSFENNKIISAICVAPNILCNAGILKNKKATAWAFEVNNCDAIIVNKNVVKDGNIITASGPYAATEFAEVIYSAILKVKE